MAGGTKKKDPFKTKKTRNPPGKVQETVEAPDEIRQAIDAFRACQDQAKHYEGEATVHKDRLMNYAGGEFARRSLKGMDSSFKIMGDESMVTYVVMDSSAGLTEEDVDMIRERWGEAAADELVARDFRSIRFDPKVLEANYDAVVDALSSLPEEVVENLFKPMLMKASPGAVDLAKKYANKPEELQELMENLKLKHYIR